MNTMKKKGSINADSVIGLLVVIIVIIAAAIPVTLEVIANVTGLTGTTLIVVNLIPLFLGLAALVVTAKAMKGN
jgi:hypothetical protein